MTPDLHRSQCRVLIRCLKFSTQAAGQRALSEENYILAQTNILHLATIDFSRFIRIGLGAVDIQDSPFG